MGLYFLFKVESCNLRPGGFRCFLTSRGGHFMENFKLLLIDRLKSKGMDSALIPAFLKALTSLISSEPGIEPAQATQ